MFDCNRSDRSSARLTRIVRQRAAHVEVVTRDGRVVALMAQPMELGAPGADGRPRPVATDAPPHRVPADLLITAIGEVPDTGSLAAEGLDTNRWGPEVDPKTQAMSLPGVFAGGDFVTGPSTAIEAIAAGRRAAQSIDAWLRTGTAGGPPPLVVSRRSALGDVDSDLFGGLAHEARSTPSIRPAKERRADFSEVEAAIPEPVAQQEALRCLQCGCDAFDFCTLRSLMDEYQVEPARLAGHAHRYEPQDLRDGLRLDMNKCIRCARCVRVCSQLAQVDALDFVGRGFDNELLFAVVDDATLRRCDACLADGALCVDTCPTGALSRPGDPGSAEPEIIALGRRG